MKKVSIVVPVYKSEAFLPKLIDSVLGQSYTNLELILVDDESPDNSGKICDDYAQKDKRILVIHKKMVDAVMLEIKGWKWLQANT